MKRNMIIVSAIAACLVGIRKQLELVSYNCKDKDINEMCEDIEDICDKINNRADVMFRGVKPVQEEWGPEPDLEKAKQDAILEAEIAIDNAQKLFVAAKTDEQLEEAEEAINAASETLNELLAE